MAGLEGPLGNNADDGSKGGHTPAGERAALGTLCYMMRWERGGVMGAGSPTPASKLRSKISLMVQADPRTIKEAIKYLNISIQKVCKSKLV